MLGENPHDGRLVGGSMARVCGQQHLLLDPKVLAALAVPELEEPPSCLGGGGRSGVGTRFVSCGKSSGRGVDDQDGPRGVLRRRHSNASTRDQLRTGAAVGAENDDAGVVFLR